MISGDMHVISEFNPIESGLFSQRSIEICVVFNNI